MPKIEIVAIGAEKIYSAGKIHITSKGDVYHIYKMNKDGGSHLSRHRDGTLWWSYPTHKQSLRKGVSIKDFSGLEFLETQGFGLDSLPVIYNEYKMQKCDGVFAIDMRNYEDGSFNLAIAIFTEEGLLKLFNSFKNAKKKQIYLYSDCHPKVALIALDMKKD